MDCVERIAYSSFGGGNAARIFRGCFSGVSPALFRGKQVRQKNLVFFLGFPVLCFCHLLFSLLLWFDFVFVGAFFPQEN